MLTEISTIDGFVAVVNNLEETPQRGFSYKPNSAAKLSANTLLFHSTTKENIISILQNGLRGVLFFKSNDSCKVYNTGDKQFQVVFDVTHGIDVVCVVNVKIDTKNTKEWIWDVYDENMNLIENDVKLSIFLKRA